MICDRWGDPGQLSLREVADPVVRHGEVVIDVHACSLNFADLLMIEGKYQTRPTLPFVPGLEAAGTIAAAAPGSGFEVGDRVVAFLWHGGFAEKAVASARETFHLPASINFGAAAALSSAFASTDLALRRVAALAPNQTLLVLGAGGGVGLAAVQIGKAIGASVIAVASTDEKLAAARESGADLLLNHQRTSWKDEVLAFTGQRGADVCVDPVGGALADDALSALGWGGRYVVLGSASGQVAQIPANRLLVKHRSALGCSLRYFRRHHEEALRESMRQLFAWHAEGKINPRITRWLSLSETPNGLFLLRERQVVGRAVVQVRDDVRAPAPSGNRTVRKCEVEGLANKRAFSRAIARAPTIGPALRGRLDTA